MADQSHRLIPLDQFGSPPPSLSERVRNDFAYHPPSTPEVVKAHEEVRRLLGDVALFLLDVTPPGREQSLMLTSLEEAGFWANAGIARGQFGILA